MDDKIKSVLNFIFIHEIDTIFKIHGHEFVTLKPIKIESCPMNYIKALTPNFDSIDSQILNPIQEFLLDLEDVSSKAFQKLHNALKSVLKVNDKQSELLKRTLWGSIVNSKMKLRQGFDYQTYWNKLISTFCLNKFDNLKVEEINIMVLVENYDLFVNDLITSALVVQKTEGVHWSYYVVLVLLFLLFVVFILYMYHYVTNNLGSILTKSVSNWLNK